MHVVKELCFADNSPCGKSESAVDFDHENENITTMTDPCVSSCHNQDDNRQGYSHGYMPRHFLSRNRGWLKAIRKTQPHRDSLESPTKYSDPQLRESDAGESDADKSEHTAAFHDAENNEHIKSGYQMPACNQLDLNQPLDVPNTLTDPDCRSCDNIGLLEMSCGSDNDHDGSLVRHQFFDDVTDQLRKNTMLLTSAVSECQKARPQVTRQCSLSPPQSSPADQPSCLNTDVGSFSSEDPSKYLRNSDQSLKRGHRSTSDLGFCHNVPGLNRQKSRVLALLQKPVFRRSIARTMKLDPEHEAFDTDVFEKLSAKVEESFDQSGSLSHHLDASSEPSLRLCCSTSDLGMLKNLHRCLEGSEISKRGSPNQNANVGGVHDSGNAISAHSEDCIKLSARRLSADELSLKATSPTSKQLSSFRIPSYWEFKAERRRQRFLSKSAANLASLVPTILEEDDFVADGGRTANCRIDVASSEASVKLKNEREQKHERTVSQPRSPVLDVTGDGDVLRDNADSVLPNEPNTEKGSPSAANSQRYSFNSERSSHCTTGWKLQGDGKHFQKLGEAKPLADQGNVILQEGRAVRTNDTNNMLSDYASESTDEYSDGLEDVLLMPTALHKAHNSMCLSDVSDPFDDNAANSVFIEVSSDSGCLVDRKLLESEQTLDDGVMLRSTSDVSDMFAMQLRTQGTREQKNKQSKSDPLNITEEKDAVFREDAKQLHRNDSKEDILNFLENNIQETVSASFSIHGSSFKHCSEDKSKHSRSKHTRISAKPPTGRRKVVSASATLERVDSGVGNEYVDDVLKFEMTNCEDCKEALSHPSAVADVECSTLCSGCKERRYQRKEAIVEIVDTEHNYGKDLNIINEHFFESMKNMGLLNAEQMKIIFINLSELISVNQYFIHQLKSALDVAAKKNDELLWSVNIGQLFLDSSNMLLAYETYCINQSAAPVLLDKLLEEKDLLRIFLEVTQREKSVLRKMDLKSFLMLPVQRVMKYPLLLNRLYKVTPSAHPDCDNILQAQKKIENILELINSKTKGSSAGRLRRRTSSLHRSQDLDNMVYDNLEVHKVIMENLDWDPSKMHFMQEGCLLCAVITDNMSLKRGRNLKYTQVHSILISLGKSFTGDTDVASSGIPNCSQIEHAALVLVKEKGNRPQLFRDPFFLNQCIVCLSEDHMGAFEIHDANKDSLLLKCKELEQMQEWFKQLQSLVAQLSRWRHRRNALANIMLHDL